METFINLVSAVDLATKQAYLKCLEKMITEEKINVKKEAKVANINDFVHYEDNFIVEGSDLHEKYLVDYEKFRSASSSIKEISNSWLTQKDTPYSWMSSKGPVINHPKPISEYAGALEGLNLINEKWGYRLNACLVSYHPSEKTSLSLHTDNESILDHSQPIVNVCFGVTRRIEYLRITQNHNERPLKAIELKPLSVFKMLPGCQSFFKHRVPQGTLPGDRILFSYRAIKETPNIIPPVVVPTASNQTPRPSNLPPVQPNISPPAPTITPVLHKPADTTVLFGTSITSRIISSKLTHGTNKKVINISQSGAKIRDIAQNMEKFYEDAKTFPEDIEKIVFSFGTNDIRFSRGVNQYHQPIIDLIEKTKKFFPRASIVMQSVLPIKVDREFTGGNFRNFNRMLFNICKKEKCAFLDIFDEYIAFNRYTNKWDYNPKLYFDKLHLNNLGLGKLARALKNVVRDNIFNPHIVCQRRIR